jgi:hypothetical protein
MTLSCIRHNLGNRRWLIGVVSAIAATGRRLRDLSQFQEVLMNKIAKTSAALALGGALLAGSVTASSARDWRPWAAAGAGFVAGAAIAGAAANNSYYYGPGYYERGYAYEPGYAYGSTYSYEPGYSSYSYEPSYSYQPAVRGWGRCQTDEGYGRRANCGGSQ